MRSGGGPRDFCYTGDMLPQDRIGRGSRSSRMFLDQRAAVGEMWTTLRWSTSGYAVPAPKAVKMAVLQRYGDVSGNWIESGTYLGRTTRALARRARSVITIEPSDFLAARAQRKFKHYMNVQVIHGLSEDVLPLILSQSSGPLSLWLDGHASGGLTHSGPSPTPIRAELSAIAEHCAPIKSLAVLVDDFRGFGLSQEEGGAYPHRSYLVDWADSLGLSWTIEHDIFAAWRA